MFPSTYCANDVIVFFLLFFDLLGRVSLDILCLWCYFFLFFYCFLFVGTCFPGHNVLILFTDCFGTGWCPYDTSLDWRSCAILFTKLICDIVCFSNSSALMLFVFWLWTILNRALCTVCGTPWWFHGTGTQMSGIFFLTTTFDGTVGSLTCRWGSLLPIPDAFFQLHLPRTLCLIHLPQYCLNWLYLHCI